MMVSAWKYDQTNAEFTDGFDYENYTQTDVLT